MPYKVGDKKENYTISVIVPVYNMQNWLRDCLESLVTQSVPFSQIILVDDESEDQSLSIMERYREIYSNIEVYGVSHRGLGAVRNFGFTKVKTDYVMYVDSDDLLNSTSAEKLLDELNRTSVDYLSYCGEAFGEKEASWLIPTYQRNPDLAERTIVTGDELFHHLYPKAYYESACMAVYRVNFLKEKQIRFPEGVFFEDNYYTFFAMTRADTASWINQNLYQRRVRKGSIIFSEYTKKKLLDFAQVLTVIYRDSQGRPLYSDKIYRNYFRALLASFLSKYENHIMGKHELSQEEKRIIDRMLDEYDKYRAEISSRKSTVIDIIMDDQLELKMQQYGFREWRRDDMEKELIECYRVILSKLPFHTNQVIGIYGVGKHTAGLLAAYQKLVGEIKATLFYITTNSTEDFQGNSVYLVKEVDFSHMDVILLSSAYYGDEMEAEVRKRNAEIPILRLYEKGDVDCFSGFANLEIRNGTA